VGGMHRVPATELSMGAVCDVASAFEPAATRSSTGTRAASVSTSRARTMSASVIGCGEAAAGEASFLVLVFQHGEWQRTIR